jgi:hypothetical protein
MKRALYLIIDRLGDVSQAIAFAKEQDDPDLWEDLLRYSMDKPRFIRGLLEEVGTAINPIALVRRIPEGLEIPGLREGLTHIMKEHEIQHSISGGVARVLRSEVSAAQARLRDGQRKGIKFQLVVRSPDRVDVLPKDVPTTSDKTADPNGVKAGDDEGGSKQPTISVETAGEEATNGKKKVTTAGKKWQPGHCAQCLEAFTEWEPETLVGFACGHVFHVTHLMALIHPGQPPGLDFLLTGTGEGDDDYDGVHRSAHFLVGPKVTRARLLRDRIRGGCPVCQMAKALVV